ncbi:MAG TPA: ABC transporter permease [Pyrinomonadaceae bacterium]|nr:ABC transporter permease [Pyrinomonadaceae bacterium]
MWWHRLFHRSEKEEELDKELRFHLDQHTSDLIAQGYSPEEARRQARLTLGGPEQVKEECRDARGTRWLEDLLQDVRYSARVMRKNPGFTAVAVLTLALGIGANAAIFSVVNGLLLRPLPYRDSERLAIIWTHSPGANVAQDWPSPGQFSAIKSLAGAFEDMALAQGASLNLAGESGAERVDALRVPSNMFTILGASPQLGRAFLPEEDAPGKPPSVVLSHGLWQRRFGGDRGVLGRQLTINGQSYTVVGVMPADFSLGFDVMPTVGAVQQPELFLPLPLSAESMRSQGDENYNIITRLKPGVGVAQARAELDAAARQLAQQFPDTYPPSRAFSFSISPLLEQVVGDVRPALLILLGAVGCVLLIACANVANLLLARAAVREREMALRTALGAGRWRVVRQLLTESLALSCAGGGLGLLVAYWGLNSLRALGPGNIPRVQDIAMDARVLAFTFGVAVLTGVLFGLAPALRGSRVNPIAALKEGGRGSAGGHRRLRDALVVAEISLSLILLVGAGLLIRSFARVQQVQPGFDTRGVVSMRLSVAGTSYAGERAIAFYQQLLERVRHLPGIESAGATSILPLGGGIGWGGITIEGYVPATGQSVIQADQRIAGTGYFETMKVPLVSGRYFDERDAKDSTKVAIVDEKMARTYWPDRDPVGKRMKPGGADDDTPWLTVVGVVGNVKQYALDADSRVTFYTPHQQNPSGTMYLAARTSGDPRGLTPAVVKEARSLDPNVAVFDIKTMGQRLSESLARRRFAMLALGLFALVAMLLAAVGIYGVMSYSVAQRTREIGVRVALGAQPRDVLALVIRQGLLLALIGVGAGLAGAGAVTRVMGSLLFGVSATDPATFAAIPLLLVAVALLSCYVPARRATKVDPMIALRAE